MRQYSCLDNDGKWATNGNYCIRRYCVKNKSCKPSYENNSICESLSLGVGQNELFFHLGMPESINGNLFTFTGGGGESKIKAIIKNGKVDSLQCRT